jgi:hypothetical protein
MEAYEDYLKMFDFFNVGTITVVVVIFIFIYIGLTAIKHFYFINTVKKAVKDAIKELSVEDINRIKQNDDIKEDNIQK